MSLSDYISIFDTRPIAQSHLTGAATATLCRHNATTQRRAATSALRSARGIEREREPWNTNGSPRQNRATPHRATPSRATRHATLRQAPSRPSRPPLSLSLHAAMLTPMFQRSYHHPPPSSLVLRCTFIEHTYARRCTTRSGLARLPARLVGCHRFRETRCSSSRTIGMERDGAGQEWKERACLTSDEFPRGHRRAPIVHARYGGEIRVYRRAADRIRGICAPLSFASPISHRRRRRERNPQKFDCDYRPLRHRFDLARGFSPRFHSDDREGIERADSNRFPSFGRCSFSRDGCASLSLSLPLLFPREREGDTFRDELERKRGVSFFRGNVDAFRKRGSTGCSSLGSTWQMGGEDPADSCRGWRGDVEKGKGASWEREEGKARERLSRRFVATCPLSSAGTRVCTHDTVKLPRQKQLPYRPTVRATNPGQ